MKREFLKNFKVGEQEIPKEVIDAIMDENGRDIEAAKKPFTDYDDIKSKLGDANRTIESFKGMDIDAIRKEAGEWQKKYEDAERDHAVKLADMEFDRLLEGAVSAAKGHSVKAILGELGAERVAELKSSKNQEADIKAALEALKGESGYLFDADGAKLDSGGQHGPGVATDYSKMSDEEYYAATMKKE